MHVADMVERKPFVAVGHRDREVSGAKHILVEQRLGL